MGYVIIVPIHSALKFKNQFMSSIIQRFVLFVFAFLLGLFLLFNCSQENKKTETNVIEVSKAKDNGEPDAQTLEMIQRVKDAVEEIDLRTALYVLNSEKVAMIEKELQQLQGKSRTNLLFTYAIELLNTGRTEEAISIFNEVLNTVISSEVPSKNEVIYIIKKQLAIAYMRKAEQENCLTNHNEDSCIIPLSTKGQHLNKEGAEKSIAMLNDLLEVNPNDYECQYLLNIAYMALGKYPHEVPNEYKIPEAYFNQSAAFPKFKDIAMSVGVDANQMAGGTIVDDFNGDGYIDIMASSWGYNDQIHYYENNRNGGFDDKTLEAGLKGVTGGLNLRHADFNNDGFLDFIILRGAWLSGPKGIPNSLMKNNGDGTFTDVTISSGIFSQNPTQTAVWFDINLDGWIDLFIGNEWSPINNSYCELFLNKGDGSFIDIAQQTGLKAKGFFKGVASGDINNDLYPDLYLSDYSNENLLFQNITTVTDKPVFKSIGVQAKVTQPINSFPTWMFDFDNDGFEDIFVSGYSTVEKLPAQLMVENIKHKNTNNRPLLYKNLGNGKFEEISLKAHLNEPIATMGCNYGDLDNDGYLDFYLSTGDPDYFSIVPNRMYHNVGGKRFEDITYSGGFGHIQKGHAIGFGDLDLDGDQDIYAVMGGAYEGDIYRNLLFENPIGNKNNWVNIKLEGTKSNRSAIGAKIMVTIEENGKERNIYHSVGTDASFGGNSLLAEIGLGKATIIKKLQISWPHFSKKTSVFENVSINKNYKITEGNGITEMTLKTTPFSKIDHSHIHR